MSKLTQLSIGMVLGLLSMSAQADLVLWTVQDLFFADDHQFRPPASDPLGELILFIDNPVAVTGSFVYDADTNIVSDVNIYSPDGEWVVGCTAAECSPASTTIRPFTGFDPSAGQFNTAANRLGLFDSLDLTQFLLLTLAGPLTNLGGEVAITRAFEFQCGSNCPAFTFGTDPFRTEIGQTGARVVGVPIRVPEPGTLALLGIGLAGMGFARRRRNA